MDIVKKLGIKPIKRFECIGVSGLRKNAVCESSDVEKLEQQRDETLEALINTCLVLEAIHESSAKRSLYFKNIKVIERISEKTWNGIKDLLND